jgi:hypothetical protein
VPSGMAIGPSGNSKPVATMFIKIPRLFNYKTIAPEEWACHAGQPL